MDASRTVRHLEEARSRSTVAVSDLATYVCGSQGMRDAMRRAWKVVADDSVLAASYDDLSLEEVRALTWRKVVRVLELEAQPRSEVDKTALRRAIYSTDESLLMRHGVHTGLFTDTIRNLGTDAQFAALEDDLTHGRMFGCFAMTELGTSSNLQGLETTATFEPTTQEFVVLSPTVTATKWWIGAAGQTATHTVALCQLRVGGKDHGLVWLLIQLRDKETGIPMPGVEVGDVGPKAGRNGVDNGWIRFNNVRVPLRDLLSRFTEVASDGTVTQKGDARASYSTLLGERSAIVSSLIYPLAASLTIAVRYGAVREQGPSNELILDYQSHLHMLVPNVALCYSLVALAGDLNTRKVAMFTAQAQQSKEYFDTIPDFHCMTAGMKAWTTWWAGESLDVCRQSLGGHGYSMYNAVAGHLCDHWVMTTGGGDNIVMAQQCAKVLLRSLQRLSSGKPAVGSASYLNRAATALARTTPIECPDFANPTVVTELVEWASIYSLKRLAEGLAGRLQAGVAMETAWNEHMMEGIEVSRLYANVVLLSTFHASFHERSVKDSPLSKVLASLWFILALKTLLGCVVQLLEGGAILPSHVAGLRSLYHEAVIGMRGELVVLVDAFEIPDVLIRSPLGRYSGDVYEPYLRQVQTGRLAGRAPYWDDLVRPVVTAKAGMSARL